MSPFKQKVIEIIRLVPPGKVVSYGQVAAYAGTPRAAREVGWILNSLNEFNDVPWWRVVNNKGLLSIRGNQTADKELQKKLLKAEGIIISDDFELDMTKYRYIMPLISLKKMALSEEYIEKLTIKYGL